MIGHSDNNVDNIIHNIDDAKQSWQMQLLKRLVIYGGILLFFGFIFVMVMLFIKIKQFRSPACEDYTITLPNDLKFEQRILREKTIDFSMRGADGAGFIVSYDRCNGEKLQTVRIVLGE